MREAGSERDDDESEDKDSGEEEVEEGGVRRSWIVLTRAGNDDVLYVTSAIMTRSQGFWSGER